MPGEKSGTSPPPQPRIREVGDVIRALQRARGRNEDTEWGGVTFLIGAGCSKTAGVPLGEEIARECVLDLAYNYSSRRERFDSSDDALAWLQRNGDLEPGLEWSSVYGEIFQNHLADPSEQRPVIQRVTAQAAGINWAHLCLGELVRARCVHTVLTTNFDQLVLEGIVRTGIIPVVADGIEALNRIDGQPTHPQVVHLHGSRHTYHPRNSRIDVAETNRSQSVVRTLSDLLRSSTALIVVGYAGAEEGVMQVLVDAAQELRGKTIFWCQYDDNPDALSPLATELLVHSPGGGLLVGQDADGLFAELMRGVGLGFPRWIKRPISHWKEFADRVVIPSNPLIQEEMENHSRVLDHLADALNKREKTRGKKRKLLERARELALEGKDLEAVELFEQATPVFESWRDWQAYADAARRPGGHSLERNLLETAVIAYKQALSDLPNGDDLDDRRGALQDGLGIALAQLGKREEGTQRLEKAVEAFHAALEIRTRERLPLEWATTQNNLGSALLTLGKREEGTERFEQAVGAYRAALEVRTRKRLPLHWATTQSNLGIALRNLGERENGTQRLKQAVGAYRAALEVRTRERLPLKWATTQNNLGIALRNLGEREEGTERLEQAVQAYRAALKVHTREQLPLDWAMTQNNLGNALSTIGEREEGTERLEQAVEAYQAALVVHSREQFPLDWAMTQNNLGYALSTIGEREERTERLEQAVKAHRAALEVRTRERLPLDWATTQSNLGNALLTLAKREEGTERLEQAVQAYRAALEVHTREQLPLDWAGTRTNLGAALRVLGERQSNEETIEQALVALEEALEVDLEKRYPWVWAEALLRYGEALTALGEHRGDAALLTRAREQLETALGAYERFGSEYWGEKARRALERLRSGHE